MFTMSHSKRLIDTRNALTVVAKMSEASDRLPRTN